MLDAAVHAVVWNGPTNDQAKALTGRKGSEEEADDVEDGKRDAEMSLPQDMKQWERVGNMVGLLG